MATLGKVMGLAKASSARATKLMGVSVLTLAKTLGVGMGVQASGGTISYSGSYTIHKFTAGGYLIVTTGGGQAGGDVEYLVVAGGGGGGGGYTGGGGGAGGYLAGTGHAVTPQSYPITVGAGGDGVKDDPDVVAANGGNSVFDTKTAIGGGRGASEAPDAVALVGGSGGGGAWTGGFPGGEPGAAGTPGPPIQGYAGGDGGRQPPGGAYFGGGGGGGSSGVGTTFTTGETIMPGGVGTSNSISGSPVTYATGGDGVERHIDADGADAAANTGDGGGAGGNTLGNTSTGGNGGSGIVSIRYL